MMIIAMLLKVCINTKAIGFIDYNDDYDNETLWSESINDDDPITVRKYSSDQLTLTNEQGTMIADVDKDGNLSIPSYSYPETSIELETGDVLTLKLTETYTGVITGRTLYLQISVSGTAKIVSKEGTFDVNIEGNVVYNGTKK